VRYISTKGIQTIFFCCQFLTATMIHLWKSLKQHYTCKLIHFISFSYQYDEQIQLIGHRASYFQLHSRGILANPKKEPVWWMICRFLNWWFDRVGNGIVSHRKWNSTFSTKEMNFYTMDPPRLRRDIELAIKRTPDLPANSQQTPCLPTFNSSDISFKWNRTPKSDAGNLFYSQRNLISS
jgi:hypothetical protein